MQDKEIIQKWLKGLSKEQLAKQYKRQYNMQIRNIRAEVRNRHNGRFITQYEALAYVEKIIYRYLKEMEWKQMIDYKITVQEKADKYDNLINSINKSIKKYRTLAETTKNEDYKLAYSMLADYLREIKK